MKYLVVVLVIVFSVFQSNAQMMETENNACFVEFKSYSGVTLLIKRFEPIGMNCTKKNGQAIYCIRQQKKFDNKFSKIQEDVINALKKAGLKYVVVSEKDLSRGKYADKGNYPIFMDYKLETITSQSNYVYMSTGNESYGVAAVFVDRNTNEKCQMHGSYTFNMASPFKTMIRAMSKEKSLYGTLLE